MSKKFYAVRNGKKVGIFDTWDECKKQVIGYKSAEYKSFKTLQEAKVYLSGCENNPVDMLNISKDEIIAYVDGSYNIENEKFGYGIVLLDVNGESKFKGSFYDENLKDQRNVAGEVLGSLEAIKKAIDLNKRKIYLHYDYKGIQAWAEGEWKRNIDLTKNYKEEIDTLKKDIDIKFIKVKAHSNDKYNDLADLLAKESVGLK